MERKVDIITDLNGNKLVLIQDVFFKGKNKVDWDEVENYLKQYIGEVIKVEETEDLVYIGADLPDEYAHSNYTNILKGANEKAKANAIVGIPELVEIATNKKFSPNYKVKHKRNARFGWYRYTSRFALPVYDNNGEIERYNFYNIVMVVRHDSNGKYYLYDLLNIKKETSNPFESKDSTQ